MDSCARVVCSCGQIVILLNDAKFQETKTYLVDRNESRAGALSISRMKIRLDRPH